jgi:hypothetical protein
MLPDPAGATTIRARPTGSARSDPRHDLAVHHREDGVVPTGPGPPCGDQATAGPGERGVALWPIAAGLAAGLGVLTVGWNRWRRDPAVVLRGAVRP